MTIFQKLIYFSRFNTVERVICYSHDIKAPGIDHCYDCRAEVFILEEYLKIKHVIKEMSLKVKFNENEYKDVTDLIKSINHELNASRKTEGLKLTINGETKLYSVVFTDIYYDVDYYELFHPDKIVNRQIDSKQQQHSDKRDEIADLYANSKNLSAHTLQYKKCEYETFSESSRYLDHDSFREKIRPKERYQFNDSTTVYFRERSLRLSEIEFLTMCCNDIGKVSELKCRKLVLIYAGCAPSKSLHFLQDMFPFIHFILYDPAKMLHTETSSMVEIKQELFTDEIALQLKETYPDRSYFRIFISNIKRAKNFASIENTQLEMADMQMQMNCLKNLDPFKSMLRFRVPYPETRANTKPELNYLNGKLLFKLWTHIGSMDTNLIVDKLNNNSLKQYRFMKYKNQLYRFNTVERVLCYDHDLDLVVVDGLDRCYDCRAEIFIFESYIKCQEENSLFLKIAKSDKTHKTLQVYLEEFNEQMDAHEKIIRLELNKEKFELKFTDIRYGKKFTEMFKKKIDESDIRRRLNFATQKEQCGSQINKRYGQVYVNK